MATCGGRSPGENTQIFGGSACFLPELNVKPDTLKGKRFGVPRMFINKDELAGTGENPGIGGPTGQRIHTRASVIDLWEAARKTLEEAGADVVEVDFPLVSNCEGDRPGAPTVFNRGSSRQSSSMMSSGNCLAGL